MESHAEYMLRRSREEQDAANRATDPKARELHNQLADRYRDAADGDTGPKIADVPVKPGLPHDLRILE